MRDACMWTVHRLPQLYVYDIVSKIWKKNVRWRNLSLEERKGKENHHRGINHCIRFLACWRKKAFLCLPFPFGYLPLFLIRLEMYESKICAFSIEKAYIPPTFYYCYYVWLWHCGLMFCNELPWGQVKEKSFFVS